MATTEPIPSSSVEEGPVPIPGQCGHLHTGRRMLDVSLPISGEKVFRIIFDPSTKFFKDFITRKGCTNVNLGEWAANEEGLMAKTATWLNKCNTPIGVQTTNITQKQVVLRCENEDTCAVSVHVTNTGVPIVNYFSVSLHYCIQDNSKDGVEESQLTLFAEIVFVKEFKDCMDILRRFILHNTFMLLEDFYANFTDALLYEIERKGVASLLEDDEPVVVQA